MLSFIFLSSLIVIILIFILSITLSILCVITSIFFSTFVMLKFKSKFYTKNNTNIAENNTNIAKNDIKKENKINANDIIPNNINTDFRYVLLNNKMTNYYDIPEYYYWDSAELLCNKLTNNKNENQLSSEKNIESIDDNIMYYDGIL